VALYYLYDNLSQDIYAEPWRYSQPLQTPDGIADTAAALQALRTAADMVQSTYGQLDIPWGKVHRLHVGKYDLPGNGAHGRYGVFRVTRYTTINDTLKRASGGDSFVALVEFSDPVRAKVLLSYGNASQEDSPHHGDQLELYTKKELRTAWLSRDSVEAHLEKTDTLIYESNY